jgi:hypothetical protein
VYGYIDAIIVDILLEQAPQRGRPAAHIKQIALLAVCHLIYYPSRFLEPEVGPGELQVLFAPEISLIVFHGASAVTGRNVLAIGRLVHDHLLG